MNRLRWYLARKLDSPPADVGADILLIVFTILMILFIFAEVARLVFYVVS